MLLPALILSAIPGTSNTTLIIGPSLLSKSPNKSGIYLPICTYLRQLGF